MVSYNLLNVISILLFVQLGLCHKQTKPTKPECPSICPFNYFPVCGKRSDGYRNFGNSCTLGVYNCENPKNQFTAVYEEGQECKETDLPLAPLE